MIRQITFLLLSLILTTVSCKQDKSNKTQEQGIPGDSIAAAISLRIQEDPENASLYFERAQRFLEIDQGQKALDDINTAIGLEPDNISYQLMLSDIYFSMGKARDCKSTLESIYNAHPENKEAILKLAELSFYFRKYDESSTYLDLAEELDKREPRIHFMRGFLNKEKGDTLAAVRNFMKTIEYDPEHFDANIQLGLLYAAKGDPLAINFYQNALKIRPKNIEALYNLGMYYQEQEDFNEAMAIYTEILDIDPTYKFALFNLGYIHVELKIYSEGAMYFNKAINADPLYLEGYYGRAYCFEMLGDVMNAQADYRKCLEIKPGYTPAMEGLNRIAQGLNALPVQPGQTQ